MDSVTIENVKENFLETLDAPANFNDWLQGTHFSSRYLSQLERTSTACSQAICASNVAIANSSAPSKRREKLLQQQLEKNKLSRLEKPLRRVTLQDSSKVDSSTTAVLVMGEEEQEHQKALMGEESVNEVGENSHQKEQVKNGFQENAMEGENGSDRVGGKKKESQSLTAPKPRIKSSSGKKNPLEMKSMKGGDEIDQATGEIKRVGSERDSSGNTILTSAEIRAQLRNSYYQMKAANAFGNTFPALLTPLNRPIFHLYDEWDLPQGRGDLSASDGVASRTPGALFGSSIAGPANEEYSGEWQDMTGGSFGNKEGRIDYPYQNEVLNQMFLRNLMEHPSGPPAFYPTATRIRRAPRKRDVMAP